MYISVPNSDVEGASHAHIQFLTSPLLFHPAENTGGEIHSLHIILDLGYE